MIERLEKLYSFNGLTMIASTLGTMSGEGHTGKEFRAIFFTEHVEHHACHAAFAVVLMAFHPGIVVAIGDRALADVEAQKFRATLDGEIDIRIFQACLPCHDQRDCQGYAGSVHHAVTKKSSIGFGESMAPRADVALAFRCLKC